MRLTIFGSKKDIMQKLKYYLFIFGAIAFASCSDEVVSDHSSPFLNGSEKTPLEVTALLESGSQSQTRATDMSFENGDQFVAYLRHVTWDGNTGVRTSVAADQAPLLVTFTKGSETMSSYTSEIYPIGLGGQEGLGITSTNTQQTSDLTASHSLFWDDFSNSASAETDLRTDGHYLESFYGYCYNGGAPTTSLTSETGELGWTVSAAQDNVPTGTEKSNFQKSDLLWSAEQYPVKYTHNVDGRPSLTLPYTHAMSKVTIELVLNEGFDVYPADNTNAGKAIAFGENNTTPTLYANRVTTTTAPTYTHSTIVATGDDARIQMRLANDEVVTNGVSNKTRVYEAIIAPTVMKNGQKLAEVTVDGNRYDIGLTDEILNPTTVTNNWSSKLNAYTVSDDNPKVVAKTSTSGGYSVGNGGITLAGVNYRIRVELNKQKSGVTAYITDWNDVSASTKGTISFNADVVTSDVLDATTEVKNGSFDLWRSTRNSTETDYDSNETEDGINKASTYEYNDNKWQAKAGQNLYWKDQSTSYYFRALATAASYDSDGKVTSLKAPSTETDATPASITTAKQGIDLLWAETSRHKAKDANGNPIHNTQTNTEKVYEAGEAIDPRTGDVPLTFTHAMSKITVTLQTSSVPEEHVDISGAKISIINLYDQGTISVMNGAISNLSTSTDEPMTIKDVPVDNMKDYLVVPQSLTHYYDGNTLTERTSTPVFYSADQLTAIYSNGSSLAPEGETRTDYYYLTSKLHAVPDEYYSSEEVKTHNRTLDGHKNIGDIRVPGKDAVYYTAEEFISGNIHKKFTQEQFDLLGDPEHPDYKKAKLKSEAKDPDFFKNLSEFYGHIDSEQKYNELPESFRLKTNADGDNQATYYLYDEFKDPNNSQIFTERLSRLDEQYKVKSPAKEAEYYNYEEYTTLDGIINNDMFDALPAVLKIKEAAVPPILYTIQEEVDEDNEKLPGAIHTTDIKIPAHYVLPDNETPRTTNLTPHAPGSLQTIGNKIMLYVYLSDGITRYSAELSKCLQTTTDSEGNTTNGDAVETWESNHHYTYTITLAKEKISFRALVEDWEVKNVGGNATLDWD